MASALLIALLEDAAVGNGAQLGLITLMTAAVGWAALWINVVVLPFYNKGESLHRDYWANGRINAALGAIEADRLIPALARMFRRVLDAQTDKRKRPESEIQALLESVEFLPDLKAAQEAMSTMDGISNSYSRLKQSASRLWKWGLFHALLTPLLSMTYVFLLPLADWVQWGLAFVVVIWLLALLVSLVGIFRMHSQLGRFSKALEIEGAA